MQPKEIRIYAKTPAGFGYTVDGGVLSFTVRPLGDLDWPGGAAPESGFVTLRPPDQAYTYRPPRHAPLAGLPWWFWAALTALFLLATFVAYFAGAAGRPADPPPEAPVKVTEAGGVAVYRYSDRHRHVYFTVPPGGLVVRP